MSHTRIFFELNGFSCTHVLSSGSGVVYSVICSLIFKENLIFVFVLLGKLYVILMFCILIRHTVQPIDHIFSLKYETLHYYIIYIIALHVSVL
jgi:hypothetical protein